VIVEGIVAALTVFAMVSVIVYVEFAFSKKTITKKSKYVLYYVLLMMASMFIGLSWYIVEPKGFLNSVVAINIIMVPMISILVLLFYFYSMEWKPGRNVERLLLPSIFVLNEFLMSLFVLIILGFRFTPNILNNIPLTVNSLYFVIPMEVEMVFSIFLFRIKGMVSYLLIALAAMDLISPALFSHFRLFLLVVNALIMVTGMIIILEEISSSKTKIAEEKRRIIDVSMVIYLLNSIGFFVFYSSPSGSVSYWLPYSISILTGMFLYFFFVFSGRGHGTVESWATRKKWLFFILSSSFVVELIMSIPLDISTGIFTVGASGITSISYLVVNNVQPAFSGSFYLSILPFIGATANSPMFLLLMGLEMGSLVVFRIKKIKWFEKRVNLSFALLAFFTYTLFGPNYVGNWERLPLWANVGALGPVKGYLIVPMLLSYVLYAALVLLFGRRAYCGTLCPSAVMYGGTLGQEMISLNYSSRTSRKNIGSRYSPLIKKVAAGSWIFMLISAGLSFAISLHLIELPFDPAILYSFLIWNVLWYFFFISIPFVGMSPCRRYGWCTTGTFVGFFSKLGLFKIKAVDPDVCYKCPTKDCVTACEVGLGDLPAQFIKKGYFKSSKCVGSGSCISACPYDNIHFYDIRNVIRERLAPKGPDTEKVNVR
jgi:polyferredoxin